MTTRQHTIYCLDRFVEGDLITFTVEGASGAVPMLAARTSAAIERADVKTEGARWLSPFVGASDTLDLVRDKAIQPYSGYCNVLIPTDATLGASIPGALQFSAFQVGSGTGNRVRFIAATGVTLEGRNGVSTAGRGSMITASRQSANTWWIVGDAADIA